MDMAWLQNQAAVPPHVVAHFKAHAASGKTIKEYSIEAGLPLHTIYSWRKKYRALHNQGNSGAGSVARKQRFATLGTITLADMRQPLFDIHLGTGRRVSVYGGAQAQDLAPFLELLSSGTTLC